MKKAILFSSYVVFLVLISVGCSDDTLEVTDSELEIELSTYLKSAEFQLVSTTFRPYVDNLNFEDGIKTFLDEGEVLYQIPTPLTNSELGVLNVVRKSSGDFSSFFELRKFSANLMAAKLQYFTINGEKQFELLGQKDISNGYYVLDFSLEDLSARANGCIGDCYKTAKDACDGDGECKLLCDLLDLVGGACTVSVAIACVAHCW